MVDPSTPATLEGQTVVVTGSGRGIGRAIATELSARGAHVAMIGAPRRLHRGLGALPAADGVRAHVAMRRERRDRAFTVPAF